jgi:hypothetical protein
MADDDAPLIIGGIIALAAIFALAHGGSSSSASASSGGSSSAAARPASTATLTSASTLPKCTRVQSVKSRDGRTYTEFPTSATSSRDCTLGRGDVGPAVAALQRGLWLCMGQRLEPDGVYGPITARAVAKAGQVSGGSSAFYQPSAERHMNWPWFSSAAAAFTGRCS